jgi:SAM-dependent methyltransferase
MNTNNFSAYSQYYDLLYTTKNYAAEVQYIDELIQKVATGAKTILELGSGTGKHAKLLAPRGYNIVGIERSVEMVAIANNPATKGASFQVGDISTSKLNEKFDIAISLFHVLSYLTTNAELIKTFLNTADHLRDGGYFIFDVWYTAAVYVQKPETRVKRMENAEIEVIRLAESSIDYRTNVVDVHYEILVHNKHSGKYESVREIHPMRHFSESEIGFLAELTGFRVVRVEEFMTGTTPGPDTWGVCFVLQKK